MLGKCMHHLRDIFVPHVVIIGDSHLCSMPHSVQFTRSLTGNSYVEYGRFSVGCAVGSNQVLSTIMVNPGITVSRLINRLEKLVSDATHVFTVIGTNDISAGVAPAVIQTATNSLHSMIHSLNAGAHIYDMGVFPRKDSWDPVVRNLNDNYKSQYVNFT